MRQYILKLLLALFKDSWIRQHPIRQVERNSEELCKLEASIGRRECEQKYWQKKWIGYGKVTFLQRMARDLSGKLPQQC